MVNELLYMPVAKWHNSSKHEHNKVQGDDYICVLFCINITEARICKLDGEEKTSLLNAIIVMMFGRTDPQWGRKMCKI